MSAVGHNNFRALSFAIMLMIRTDGHQTHKLAMRTSIRIERKLAHSGQSAQCLLQSAIHLQRTLNCSNRLQRMELRECWHSGYLFVDDRIILHRATAQRIESAVHTEVIIAQIGIVAHNCQLVTLRQFGISLTAQHAWYIFRSVRTIVCFRQRISFSPCFREFENQVAV